MPPVTAASLDLSIAEARERIVAGELSPVALTQAYLERIERADGELNAFRTVAERALEQAQGVEDAARRGDPLGPLAGIPVALKDNIEVAGLPMTAGTTPARRCRPRPQRAGVAADARQRRGAGRQAAHVRVGDRGSRPGERPLRTVSQPWDPERITGGSSGGSGAAIAADGDRDARNRHRRIGAGARGLSGSRDPRPSDGRVTNRGFDPGAVDFDFVLPDGAAGRGVAAILAVIAGYDREDPASIDVAVERLVGALQRGAEGLRVGMLVGDSIEDPLPAVADAIRAAAAELERLGAVVEEIELPGRAEVFHNRRGGAARGGRVPTPSGWPSARRSSPPTSSPACDAGLRSPDRATPRAAQRQRAWRRSVVERARRARPAAVAVVRPARALDRRQRSDQNSTALLTQTLSMWVLSRTPVAGVPIGFVDGLPVGMQLVGKPLHEASVLAAAHAYQQVTDWHLQRPPALEPTA